MAGEGEERRCDGCALCCTVLRVEELGKLGGTPCAKLLPGGDGCSIHPTRPGICRAYRCLWLRGGLDAEDRPDRLGAVLDVVTEGAQPFLAIREAVPGTFEASGRLRVIAARYRQSMPVRVTSAADVMNPDRPYRVLLPDGEEQLVEGETVSVFRDGHLVETRRIPWLERALRRVMLRVSARRLRQMLKLKPSGTDS
jgi:hypothetical protein